MLIFFNTLSVCKFSLPQSLVPYNSVSFYLLAQECPTTARGPNAAPGKLKKYNGI